MHKLTFHRQILNLTNYTIEELYAISFCRDESKVVASDWTYICLKGPNVTEIHQICVSLFKL